VTKEINFCEACVGGKPITSTRSNKILDLVHSNTCRKIAQIELVGLNIFLLLSMTRHVMFGFVIGLYLAQITHSFTHSGNN